MRRMVRIVLALMLAAIAGCGGGPTPGRRSTLDQQMFGPTAIRIHPTFTQVRDWSGAGKPDGIEATLEIQDQFGEPTRATGRVTFELYAYRKEFPDVKGRRLSQPWVAQLNTREQQLEHWNSALRAYTFQLHFPQISLKENYVLTAQFDLNSPASAPASSQPAAAAAAAGATTSASRPAGRLFDQLIIESQGEEKLRGKYRAPARTPGH